MDLMEQDLSKGILRMSCAASALTVLASTTALIASPGVGIIKIVNSSFLILLITFEVIKSIKEFKDMKTFNEAVERNKIKKVRNILNSLKDEKLNEERNNDLFLVIETSVLAMLYAIYVYGFLMKDIIAGISSVSFGLSGLSYGIVAHKYQQLMGEVGIESKPFIKAKKSNRGL